MITAEVLKGIVSIGMLLIYDNIVQKGNDQQFKDRQKASDDRMKASDNRFNDLISSLKEIRASDKERSLSEMKVLELKITSANKTVG